VTIVRRLTGEELQQRRATPRDVAPPPPAGSRASRAQRATIA
jgi:hypothetical protein